MKWIKVTEKKPINAQHVFVLGQIKDRFGIPLREVIDTAYYDEGMDYFTIGYSVGELWEPQYWMVLPKLPEMEFPQKEEGWKHPSLRKN